jgi:hypothetical protein
MLVARGRALRQTQSIPLRYVPRGARGLLVGGFSLIFSGSFGASKAGDGRGCCLRRFKLALSAAASFSGGVFAMESALYLGLILTL